MKNKKSWEFIVEQKLLRPPFHKKKKCRGFPPFCLCVYIKKKVHLNDILHLKHDALQHINIKALIGAHQKKHQLRVN